MTDLEYFLTTNHKCKACGELAVPTAKDGRFYEYNGIWINLPPSFVIPRCTACGQDWFIEELQVALDAVLQLEFERHKDLVFAVVRAFEARSK